MIAVMDMWSDKSAISVEGGAITVETAAIGEEGGRGPVRYHRRLRLGRTRTEIRSDGLGVEIERRGQRTEQARAASGAVPVGATPADSDALAAPRGSASPTRARPDTAPANSSSAHSADLALRHPGRASG